MLGLVEQGSLSADAEFELRRPDFVMEMPQTGERIRGREAMRAMQRAFPTPPRSMTLRRVFGAGRVWVAEGIVDYGEGAWNVIVVFEFDGDGLIVRETRYYARQSQAPAWRSEWVESMD
jgi:SnoaL-like domain